MAVILLGFDYMRILQRVVLGLGLVLVVPLSGATAFANKAAVTQTKSSGTVQIKRLLKQGHEHLPALPETHTMVIGNQQLMPKAMYEQLRGSVLEMFQKYPPSKSFYVGLGSDPAPIMAFIQNLGGKKMGVNFVGGSKMNGQQFAATSLETLDPFVKAQIPADVLHGGRTIVLLDQTNAGTTILGFPPLFQRYLTHIGSNAKVATVAFSNQHHSGVDMVIDSGTKYPEVNKFAWAPYEHNVAEYNRWSLSQGFNEAALTSLPQFQQLRDGIMERMVRDTALDKYLVESKLIGTPQELKAWAAQAKIDQKAERQQLAQKLIQQRQQQKIAQLLKLKEDAAAAKAALGAAGKLKGDIDALVATIGKGTAGHAEGYFGESGALLNTWLVSAIATQQQSDTLNPQKQMGPNAVTLRFITDTIESAVQNKQIRRRDYRRLLGHALGFTNLDEGAIATLAKQFKKSKDMRRELTEESSYYLKGSSKQPAGTQQTMIANYNALQKAIGFTVVEKKEKEEAE